SSAATRHGAAPVPRVPTAPCTGTVARSGRGVAASLAPVSQPQGRTETSPLTWAAVGWGPMRPPDNPGGRLGLLSTPPRRKSPGRTAPVQALGLVVIFQRSLGGPPGPHLFVYPRVQPGVLLPDRPDHDSLAGGDDLGFRAAGRQQQQAVVPW